MVARQITAGAPNSKLDARVRKTVTLEQPGHWTQVPPFHPAGMALCSILEGDLETSGKHDLEKRHLEYAQSRMKLSPFSVLVGFYLERLYEGGAVLTMTVEHRHRQIHNVVHGGVIAALADTASAIAAYTAAPEGVELATIELKINYLLPIAEGKIEAEGKVLRTGRNFVVVECDVRNHDGALAAKALMTFGATGGRALEGAEPANRHSSAENSEKPRKRGGKNTR
jgi:acyl-CoA thioesterase